MAEDSGGWFGLGLGLGILIGGFFTALILKSRETQAAQTQTMQPVYQSSPINLYHVIKEQVEQVKVQEAKVQIPEAPKPPAIEPITTYKNNEKWVIERGEDGSIKSLNVVRDARVNA